MKFYLFADDTNLLYSDKNLKSLESTVNDELCKLYNWVSIMIYNGINDLSLFIHKNVFIRLFDK